MNDFNLDHVIAKLLELQDSKRNQSVDLTESEIKELCSKAREIFLTQPMILDLEAPIKICGM